jgi:hypothetical protein
MAHKKVSKPKTAAERDAAKALTDSRKSENRDRNAAQAEANRVFLSNVNILMPITHKTHRGNGSPTRLSRVKRAMGRHGDADA